MKKIAFILLLFFSSISCFTQFNITGTVFSGLPYRSEEYGDGTTIQYLVIDSINKYVYLHTVDNEPIKHRDSLNTSNLYYKGKYEINDTAMFFTRKWKTKGYKGTVKSGTAENIKFRTSGKMVDFKYRSEYFIVNNPDQLKCTMLTYGYISKTTSTYICYYYPFIDN